MFNLQCQDEVLQTQLINHVTLIFSVVLLFLTKKLSFGFQSQTTEYIYDILHLLIITFYGFNITDSIKIKISINSLNVEGVRYEK